MEQRDIAIVCDLRNGTGDATMLFTDLTHAYVDENMGTCDVIDADVMRQGSRSSRRRCRTSGSSPVAPS